MLTVEFLDLIASSVNNEGFLVCYKYSILFVHAYTICLVAKRTCKLAVFAEQMIYCCYNVWLLYNYII